VKGNIAPGYDADLVVWYPSGHEFGRTHDNSSGHGGISITVSELHHDVDYTLFEGITVGNWPRYTILGGQIVWDRDNGGIVGKKGQGRFLKRKPGTVVQGRHPNIGPCRCMLTGERELWA
jgi:dihydropyrimidinase